MSGTVTMQRVSVWVRRIATTILIPIFTAVAARFIWEQPPETAGAVLKFFLSLTEQTWLRVGFVAGLWLDWLLRRLDRSRNAARKDLGIEMQDLAGKLANGLTAPYYAELLSIFLKVGKLGVWTPIHYIQNEERRASLCGYLQLIGKLLNDGLFDEAKLAASMLKNSFEKVS
jgi:hypothetical protein